MIPLELRFMLRKASLNYPQRKDFSDSMKRLIVKKKGAICSGNVPGVKCRKVGVYLSPHLRAIDHIIPSRAGGLPSLSNGQVLCLDCHSEKSLRENKIFPKKNSRIQFKPSLARIWIECMF